MLQPHVTREQSRVAFIWSACFSSYVLLPVRKWWSFIVRCIVQWLSEPVSKNMMHFQPGKSVQHSRSLHWDIHIFYFGTKRSRDFVRNLQGVWSNTMSITHFSFVTFSRKVMTDLTETSYSDNVKRKNRLLFPFKPQGESCCPHMHLCVQSCVVVFLFFLKSSTLLPVRA